MLLLFFIFGSMQTLREKEIIAWVYRKLRHLERIINETKVIIGTPEKQKRITKPFIWKNEIKPCKACGKLFTGKKIQLYCSDTCSHASWQAHCQIQNDRKKDPSINKDRVLKKYINYYLEQASKPPVIKPKTPTLLSKLWA